MLNRRSAPSFAYVGGYTINPFAESLPSPPTSDDSKSLSSGQTYLSDERGSRLWVIELPNVEKAS